MNDQEFITELRRGLLTIMRACVKKFGLAWRDFLPRDEARMIAAFDAERSTLTYGTPNVEYHIMRDEARPE